MKKQSELEELKSTGISEGVPAQASREGFSGRILNTRDLFGSEQEIGIVHGDSLYRLRITRGGKLILNK
jgi:hemin uptake protein HemP